MRTITDFDDPTHRIESASAAFQKGLYHLFILRYQIETDAYDRTLRMYQCLFQLGLTELLLDFDYPLSKLNIQKRLRQRCKNPKQPTRRELDPAAFVTHSTLEKWGGLSADHILASTSKFTMELYGKVVESRHNLLYRPFMLDQCFWEDCILIDLLDDCPSVNQIEQAYKSFMHAILDWHLFEEQMIASKKRDLPIVIYNNWVSTNFLSDEPPENLRSAGYFIGLLFIVYEDRREKRPTETLLLTYARMLNPDNDQLLQKLKTYRNHLLDVENIVHKSKINFLDEWRVGEI